MIEKYCQNSCDLDQFDSGYYNDCFNFCPLCGSRMAERELPDPVYEPSNSPAITMPEFIEAFKDIYIEGFKKALNEAPSISSQFLRR